MDKKLRIESCNCCPHILDGEGYKGDETIYCWLDEDIRINDKYIIHPNCKLDNYDEIDELKKEIHDLKQQLVENNKYKGSYRQLIRNLRKGT